ncbi:UDP-glucose/GDP-mannose dehydrogenase family protein [Cellulosimicrobium sp. CUA-896]|uniref:UDP-glucose dehydrogenase family protein n=1 Tax=Cellulosimicrobium sp. CUA-896 TaxID=1517881 RepID=UPI0009592E1F|nr:UDP-glucose/GDP-mannose dehydrogenase family protein [Cellulosimicrobium sp. CUA-896]OLT46151.1 UDP-glucose 6-dehydrogenase [Cellulosimicrobium sp. CUA-896]
MKVSVHGCGYLGAVHAAAMAHLGHDVVGVDVDEAKVAALGAGRAPFYEPGLPDLLTDGTTRGALRFSTDAADAAGADVHFLCVGTPQSAGSGVADLHHLDAALAALRPHLRPGDVVVGKSTVPVGTAARLAAELPDGVHLAWNPEFLREGHAVEDTLHPDRLVYGVPRDEPAGPGTADDAREPAERPAQRLDAVYARLLADGVPRVVTDYATAELAKVAANAFLATKVSFANAMAEVCEAAGGDAVALVGTMSYDARIGGDYLGVGLGFGGGCLPKDIRAFAARAEELGVGRSVAFLEEVDAINERCRDRAVELVRSAGGGLAGRRVAVLGAAFKPDSDDVRSSPALDLARRLAGEGADVVVTDPQAIALAQAAAPELRYAAEVAEAVTGADVVVLATEWPEYRALDPAALAGVARSARLVDTRNALDLAAWRAAGWDARSLGGAPVAVLDGPAPDVARPGEVVTG